MVNPVLAEGSGSRQCRNTTEWIKRELERSKQNLSHHLNGYSDTPENPMTEAEKKAFNRKKQQLQKAVKDQEALLFRMQMKYDRGSMPGADK